MTKITISDKICVYADKKRHTGFVAQGYILFAGVGYPPKQRIPDIANLVVFKNKFDHYRKQILSAKLLVVEGKLQKEGEVIHVIARTAF